MLYFDHDVYKKSYELKPNGLEQIHEKIHDITLRRKVVKDEPTEKTIEIEFTESLRRKYQILEKQFIYDLEKMEHDVEQITAVHAAALSGKLRQFSNGALYHLGIKGVQPYSVIHHLKLDRIQEVIDEVQGEPLLIGYQFRFEREMIVKKYGAIPLDKNLDEWNAGKISIAVAHPKSLGHGLNLQYGGCNILWHGIPWSLEQFDQMNGRIDRQGQSKPVTIYKFKIKKSIDEVLFENLRGNGIELSELLNLTKSNILSHIK